MVNQNNKKIVLRMDDVGASSKKYEIYSKKIFGNFFFLKRLPYFKAWGEYRELNIDDWEKIINILIKYSAKLTIAVTASWVNQKSECIPFYEKFPQVSEILKIAEKKKIIEIANHGLSHCIIGKHFPKLIKSNRSNHREFWDYLPYEVHLEHLTKSQKIFYDWLGFKLKVLVPPGNVYSKKTIKAASKSGIKIINSSNFVIDEKTIRYINNDNVFPFHDRDIVMNNEEWLKKKILSYKDKYNFDFIMNL